MSNERHLVIVGTGVAGTSAALSARAIDSDIKITLIGAEPHLPYDRTHLSKQQLAPNADLTKSLLTPGIKFEQLNIDIRTGVKVVGVEPTKRTILLESSDRISYSSLILATGSIVRPIPPGWGVIQDEHLHCIRVAEDSIRLRSALRSAKKIVVIGSGLIGLEVAASARERGIDVTVIGTGSRILTRSSDPLTAKQIENIHRDRGVSFRLGVSVDNIRRLASGELAVSLTNNSVLIADDVVVGIGVLPNDGLARASGIGVNNGINVNSFGQTNYPDIFAAGEVASFTTSNNRPPFRLESWRHAQDHGHLVGANSVTNEMREYKENSSFWSDQFQHRIQGVGVIPEEPHEVIVRSYDDGAHLSIFIGRDNRLLAVVGVDCSKDISAVGRLVGHRVNCSAMTLADKNQPLGSMVKSILKSIKQEEKRNV